MAKRQGNRYHRDLEPDDINNRGEATGTGGDANGMEHAILWKNGVVTILETLPDTAESHGNSINDKGQVTGQSCSANGETARFSFGRTV